MLKNVSQGTLQAKTLKQRIFNCETSIFPVILAICYMYCHNHNFPRNLLGNLYKSIYLTQDIENIFNDGKHKTSMLEEPAAITFAFCNDRAAY